MLERQQHIDRAAREIHPEVTQRLRPNAGVNPRTKAMATAMPAAAEKKLCVARPSIVVK